MMKHLAACLLFLGFLSSCSTDFDLIAPYKETIVLYGFLNCKDPVQYIRVSRAFLGEGNTLIMAQQKDSVNFADSLDVVMDRLVGGNVVETFSMTKTDTIPKDDGVFYHPYQVYFATNHPIGVHDASQYRIRVRNMKTNTVASSITNIVGDVGVQLPSAADVDFALNLPTLVKFTPGVNSKISDVVIRFHYSELDSSTGITTQHAIDWNFSDQVIGEDLTQEYEFTYNRVDFYSFVGNFVPVKRGVMRRVDNLPAGVKPVEFRIIVGSEDFYTYYLVAQPSTGIVQDKPLFTTVENGLGLFTSRLIHSEFRDLKSSSKSAFDTSAFTRNLNFRF